MALHHAGAASLGQPQEEPWRIVRTAPVGFSHIDLPGTGVILRVHHRDGTLEELVTDRITLAALMRVINTTPVDIGE